MIGLDISSSSVKLVELSQDASGEYVLERFAAESFQKGWIQDGQIEKFDEVADAVKRLVSKSGTKTKNVVMAMPQSAVITKKPTLPNEGHDALVALFEIGADTTSLKVLRDDEMLYDRDQAFGGSQLTQLISRQYGFSFEEAEQKKLAADLPDDYESSILAPFVDSLSQEIGRALQYFFTSTPHHKVHYVMLAGGTATLPGLKDRVTELTGFASMVVNPFDNMRLGSAVRESKLRREAPSYSPACRLALRRFLH